MKHLFAALTQPKESRPLDIFSLGAVARFLFTGRPSAESLLALMDQVRQGGGTDVVDFPGEALSC